MNVPLVRVGACPVKFKWTVESLSKLKSATRNKHPGCGWLAWVTGPDAGSIFTVPLAPGGLSLSFVCGLGLAGSLWFASALSFSWVAVLALPLLSACSVAVIAAWLLGSWSPVSACAGDARAPPTSMATAPDAAIAANRRVDVMFAPPWCGPSAGPRRVLPLTHRG